MPEAIKKTAKILNDFWDNLERSKRIRLIVLMASLLVLAVIITVFVTRKEYVTLYSGLKPADAGEILEKLKEMGIDAKPKGDDTILVLKEQEPGIRMQLSSQGYPKSGFNYDLFMNGIGFGTTDYEKRKYLQFQLQERLQEAIMCLNGVKGAIVTLSLPEEDSFVFKGDEKPPSASVLLSLEQGYEITSKQVNAIEELVSKSILGLTADNISIIDSNMKLLNSKINEDQEVAGTQYELEKQVTNNLQQQVVSLLEPIFGYGKVLAAVNVKLNFDKHVKETTRFEPVVDDEGIVVSMNELREKVANGTEGGIPGMDNNGDITQYPGQNNTNQDYEKVSKTVNYEINQIKEQIETAKGKVENLSVSVVVDNADMAPDVKERVQSIVANAVGIDSANVVVDNMAFDNNNELLDKLNKALSARKINPELIKDIVLYAMLFLLLITVIFLIYRIIVEYLRKNKVAEAVSIINSQAPFVQYESEVAAAGSLDDEESNIVRDYINDLVRTKPEEVAQLLRTWLSED